MSKADAASQVMFIGRIGGTRERKLWVFDGAVWQPPADLAPLDGDARGAGASDGGAGAGWSSRWADRDAAELPPTPAELLKAIDPNPPGGQRYGGRDLMRGLGGYWARQGYHVDAIRAWAQALPSEQPERRADECAQAARDYYRGVAHVAGPEAIVRHFTDARDAAHARTVLAALDEAHVPARWLMRWAEQALASIKAGGRRSAWRVGLIEACGLAPRRGLAKQLRREDNAAAVEAEAPGLDGLETDDEARPLSTPDNLVKCVRHYLGLALALDTLTGATVLLEPVKLERGPGETLEAGAWRDGYTFKVRKALNRLRMHRTHEGDTRAAVADVASERPIDVLGDWLRELAERWDRAPRVDAALHTYWRAVDEPLSAAVSRVMLLGIAARGLRPGERLETVPILIGEQGCGKSQSLQALVWGKHRRTPGVLGYGAERRYCASKIQIGSKDALASIRGHLIWELAELASVRRADVDDLKMFLTQRSDTFRPPYAHEDVRYERSVAFVGSVNPEHSGHVIVNRDTTGGRRWAPVRVAPAYVQARPETHGFGVRVDAIAEDHEQLLGEAAARVLGGEQWHPTDAEAALLAPAVEAVSDDPVREDAWFGMVRSWAKHRAKPARGFTIAEVFSGALDVADAGRYGRAESLRLAGILRELGYVNRPSNGARRWVRVEGT
ncbi:MAG TPA: VapE domain-containing protein [Gammaproteobacteria bacterium]|nr:VapE domain-containing protein [Gammaproteobacteria bacterium]